MLENPLLLSSAKSGTLVQNPRDYSWVWRFVAGLLGCAVILVGALDVAHRTTSAIENSELSSILSTYNIGFLAFAPAAALNDPSVLTSLYASDAASSTKAAPTTLTIPSIGVEAKVELVGKKTDGSMDTPKDINNVGWYALGSAPGQQGNTVMAGHVNNAFSLPGVFTHLSEMKVGDYITVSRNDGASLVYVVNKINTYKTADAPVEEIFSTQGPSQLVLITCDGDWIGADRSFDKRLVVVARLVTS